MKRWLSIYIWEKSFMAQSFTNPTEMGDIFTTGLFLLFILSSAPLLISCTRSDEKESVECHPNDRAALLEFKAGFPPDAFPTWNTNVSCCASWEGVTCDNVAPHRVIILSVSGRTSVRGSIPPAIGRLVFLQGLSFIQLPNLVGSIPYKITNLMRLDYLIIFGTNLSTPIPSFIGEFPHLNALVLRRNNHWGPIPGSILHNRNVSVHLDLSENRLSGHIPREFGKINFNTIRLTMNQLTGDASFLFGRSKTTRVIDLAHNLLDFNLTDVVFPEVHLEFLFLQNNHIQGIIPAQIANVATLIALNLSHNHLCGRIPTGGRLGGFGPSSYSGNFCPCFCLCGTPLPPCPWDNWPSHAIYNM